MRVVVATTTDDPWAGVFWEAYYRAGGVPPATVFFLHQTRRTPWWKTALEGLLLFGPLGSARSWGSSRRARKILERTPERIFAGVTEFYRPRTLNRGQGLQLLQRATPHLLVSVGSPEIFKAPVLSAAAVGAVNVHNGRLPKYRGLFGSFWEAFAGEEWGYASIHVMETEVDSGPTLAQGVVRVGDRSLADVLAAKKQLGGRLLAWLVRFVDREGGFPPPCPYNAGHTPGYYSWPSLHDMSVLRLKKLRPRIKRSADAEPPVDTWPAGMVLGDT